MSISTAKPFESALGRDLTHPLQAERRFGQLRQRVRGVTTLGLAVLVEVAELSALTARARVDAQLAGGGCELLARGVLQLADQRCGLCPLRDDDVCRAPHARALELALALIERARQLRLGQARGIHARSRRDQQVRLLALNRLLHVRMIGVAARLSLSHQQIPAQEALQHSAGPLARDLRALRGQPMRDHGLEIFARDATTFEAGHDIAVALGGSALDGPQRRAGQASSAEASSEASSQ